MRLPFSLIIANLATSFLVYLCVMLQLSGVHVPLPSSLLGYIAMWCAVWLGVAFIAFYWLREKRT